MGGMKNYLLIAAGAAVAAIAYFHPAPAPQSALTVQPPVSRPAHAERRSRTAAVPPLVVYVAGAVRRPGLYRIAPGTRADDAVRLAGGLSAHADAAAVNLAELVSDGEEIRVPKIGEAVSRAHASRAKRSRRSARVPQASVDLNTAGVAQLGALPGIGETLAARIIEYRTQNGPFASLDELADVAGMTQRRVDALAPYLVVR